MTTSVLAHWQSASLALALSAAALLLAPGCKSTERSTSATTGATATAATAPAEAEAKTSADRAAVEARLMADLRFLAADEMRGRYTGTPENARAADYIAEVFAASGAKPVPGSSSMLTPVRLVESKPIATASVSFGESRLAFPEAVLPLTRQAADLSGDAIYLDHAAFDAVVAETVKGKVVITEAGSSEGAADPRAWLKLADAKRERMQGMGATALVEVYRSSAMPFGRIVAGVNRGGMQIAPKAGKKIPSLWITENNALADFRKRSSSGTLPVKINVEAPESKVIESNNVVATLPGTDPTMAGEYIAVTAHFDHIGVTARPGQTDSINNGARDNGMGTVALLEVARNWRANPGRRPLLLMAWTAEEVGLLGSKYWAENPTVPLANVLFNFNMDGAGYDDTTAVTIQGYGRTSAQPAVDAAVSAAGLSPKPDPIPQYNLFAQSDNYSLAAVGIPAINMAPGFTGFSEELMKYYHQPADEISTVDAGYLRRYTQAATAVARKLSDLPTAPMWQANDEFESVAKELYKR